MSKLTARLLVIAIGLIAATLACGLPGTQRATPQSTARATPNLTATTLAAGAPLPPTATGAPTVEGNVRLDTPTADYTQLAQTRVAQTATARMAAAQASPPSTVLTQGAPGALPRRLNLAFDAKGNLHLFDVAQAGAGQAIFHQQRGADGTWTQPQQVTNGIDVHSLAPLPDPNGGCLLFGGQVTANGATGVFLSCPNGDGSWPAVTEPIEMPLKNGPNSRMVALAAATANTAGALYLSPVKNALALFFSPVDLMLSHGVLAAIQVSQDTSVLEANLAYDTNGRWHAVWLENSGADTAIAIQGADSADNGKTWSAPQKLYSGTADNPSSVVMQLAADTRGNAHTAWEGDRKVIYRGWSAASGWGDAAQLSGENVLGLGERLAVAADGQVRAVWTEITGNVHSQIVYSAQAADGTWNPPQPIAADRAFDLALAVDGQGANHLVWTGRADMRYATWAP